MRKIRESHSDVDLGWKEVKAKLELDAAWVPSSATDKELKAACERVTLPRKRPLSKYPTLYNQLVLMMAKSDATKQLKDLNEKVLANGLGTDLIDKLTDTFVELVGDMPTWWNWRDGQMHNALVTEDVEVRFDDDIRFQRYTEMWCRYILILTWTSAEQAEAKKKQHAVFYQPVDVVRAVLEHVDLEAVLRSRFRKLERLGKGARLVDLIEAMLTWLSDGDQHYLKALLLHTAYYVLLTLLTTYSYSLLTTHTT